MSSSRSASSVATNRPDTTEKHSPRIVVVEDEQIVALDIRMHLQKNGYEVPATFDTGEEALARVAEIRPDLVLMDIKLRGTLDGIETAERMRSEHDIPVILLTAYADESTIERAKTTRPFAYIIKPFEERELRTAIIISLYRHEIERKLAQREQLFETTLNSIGDAVLVVGPDSVVRFLNLVACGLLGRDEDACIGRRLDEIFTIAGADRDDAAGYYRGVLKPKDGAKVSVEYVVTPRGGGDSDDEGAVWVVRDISERLKNEEALQKTEERLRHAQKMEAIGRLTSGMAHDFNNVLTVVLGYTKLVRDALGRDDEDEADRRKQVLEDIDGIQTALGRASTLTRQLLAFSRQQQLEMRVLDVNKIIEEAGRMIRRLVTETVSVQQSLSASPATVRVDQTQMEQILLNLAVNARDAMPDGGTLLFRTDTLKIKDSLIVRSGRVASGDYVVIKCKDTGHGMDRATLEHIFEPFFTTKPAGHGTGLGLATVYGLVQQWNGHLDVDSTPGKGSTFRIYLPVVREQTTEIEEPAELRHTAQGSETVLLVEEDPTLRAMLGRFLRDSGYLVLDARNAGEALLVCEDYSDEIHLIAAELHLAHLPGPRLIDRIAQQRPGICGLLLTGAADVDSSEVQDLPILSKPFNPEQFLLEVRSRLDGRRRP